MPRTLLRRFLSSSRLVTFARHENSGRLSGSCWGRDVGGSEEVNLGGPGSGRPRMGGTALQAHTGSSRKTGETGQSSHTTCEQMREVCFELSPCVGSTLSGAPGARGGAPLHAS